ncbi:flagellin lysine-N-methylase [Fibrobacter sp.]|uniref:flagellin lysine-N-methylase n=1 Tax=Fibrobacter sp. TaxID=35828 RepID=UPI003866FB8C
MILRKPDFYDQFQCIASRCTDTCCVGWEIDIDEASLEAYNKVAGAFGERLRANIEDGHFKLLPHDRCPFLDKDNLCEVYQHLGEEALCNICTEHPRFVEVFGDIMERGLGLCCEEAARLLLEGEGPLAFTSEECDEPEDELDDDDREVRDQVLGQREWMFETLADPSIPFAEKLYKVFGYTGENPFAPFESAEAMIGLLAKLESYGPDWDAALSRIKSRLESSEPIVDQGFFTETESLRLLAYLIYRHYAKCLFVGREQGKLQFALYFWNLARFFTKELAGETSVNPRSPLALTKINAVKILSKQLEYCEEIMEIVEISLDD